MAGTAGIGGGKSRVYDFDPDFGIVGPFRSMGPIRRIFARYQVRLR